MKLTVTRFNHIQLSIPEGEAARKQAVDFYGTVLGLPEMDTPQSMKDKGYFWYQLGDMELHLGAEADFRVSKRHPAFEVANIEALRAYLVAQGVEVREATPIPDRVRFFLYDPFGNRIELLSLNAS